MLEPHRVMLNPGGTGELTFLLQRVELQHGDSRDEVSIRRGLRKRWNVAHLLIDVAHNQNRT